jgi:hypothetical protein
MPRLTKTQIKRLYRDILSKTRKLWGDFGRDQLMSTADMVTIEKIVHKYQKKL